MAKKMRALQIPKAKGPLELVEREIPEPQPGWVRVKVEACGVCHSDSLVKEGQWPGIEYPRVPGHEVIGVVNDVGEGVKPWKTGQRVGVGWHGGNCGYCDPCRRGEFFGCEVALLTTGISFDGGHAEYLVGSGAKQARRGEGCNRYCNAWPGNDSNARWHRAERRVDSNWRSWSAFG